LPRSDGAQTATLFLELLNDDVYVTSLSGRRNQVDGNEARRWLSSRRCCWDW
jgi:hypothetical protein